MIRESIKHNSDLQKAEVLPLNNQLMQELD